MLASILVLSALDFQLSEPSRFAVGSEYVFYLFKRSSRHAFQHALDHRGNSRERQLPGKKCGDRDFVCRV
jgi:hypothetical protein